MSQCCHQDLYGGANEPRAILDADSPQGSSVEWMNIGQGFINVCTSRCLERNLKSKGVALSACPKKAIKTPDLFLYIKMGV